MLGDPHNAPTAIFCNSDEMAFGAIMAAKDLGLQVRGQGARAVQILLELLDDPSLEEHPNIEQQYDWNADLLVRGSTARPPHASR
jgi:DNA-binding LacI/PurR family transcriptional regulator